MTTPEAEVAQRPKPWYESFFGPDYLKQYAHTTTLQEVEGVAKILHLRQGSRVLDLACGAGRHSIELAKRGLEVVGYDLSEPLLKAARAAARKASARVTFVHGDMRDLPYHGEFDAVVNLFTSFGYFEEDRKSTRLNSSHPSISYAVFCLKKKKKKKKTLKYNTQITLNHCTMNYHK